MNRDSAILRHPDLLNRHRCRLLVVDVQEKLLPTIVGSREICRRIRFLLDAAQLMQVPVLISEQYPKGLGSTDRELAGHPAVTTVFAKQRFSACDALCQHTDLSPSDAPDSADDRDQILLVGIEAHVCVLQTAFDLLARGFDVFVAEDAVGSGTDRDRDIALNRLRDAGAVICSVEGAAFEWCETAENSVFRDFSRLVRALRDDLHGQSDETAAASSGEISSS